MGDHDTYQESDRLAEKTKRRYLDERIPLKINKKNERCFSLSKQTERTVDLARHGRTRVKANFQLSRKLESQLASELRCRLLSTFKKA